MNLEHDDDCARCLIDHGTEERFKKHEELIDGCIEDTIIAFSQLNDLVMMNTLTSEEQLKAISENRFVVICLYSLFKELLYQRLTLSVLEANQKQRKEKIELIVNLFDELLKSQ